MRRGSLVIWSAPLVAALAGAPTAASRIHSAAALSPVAATALRFTSLTAGSGFTCGLTADGVAWCWGANQYGQLGTPDSSSHCERVDGMADGPCSLRPVQVVGGNRFATIDAGSYHVCALDRAGAAYCWGKNVVGELGVAGPPENCDLKFYARKLPDYEPESCSRVPVMVATPLRFASLSAGNAFTCAVTSAGNAYCWGSRRNGHLGSARRTDRHPEVVAVDAPVPLTQISADGSLACALSRGGDVYC